MTIVGRKNELHILEKFYQQSDPAFIALYGRRRVGKTYLIEEYFKDKGLFIEIIGSKKASKQEQLRNFHREYITFFQDLAQIQPSDWGDAFYQLHNAIKEIESTQKIIFFLDELPWLAAPRSGFLQALEYSWNKYFSKRKNLILIICGSAASWMIKKIIQNKAGLYGRLSCTLSLPPFSLEEGQQFLLSKNVQLEKHQIVELFMITGGIAAYLGHVTPGKSVMQLVNELCFKPSAPLFLEFNNLFQSLFDHPDKHISIVNVLAKNRRGLSHQNLLKAVKLTPGGHTTDIINELIACGFIAVIPMFGKLDKESKYRLIDEYSLFYLCWVAKEYQSIIRGSDPEYWYKIFSSAAWLSWSGLAFENICFKHSLKIKKALGIASVKTSESYWHYVTASNSKELTQQGAEIDLVIDRADHCINLCEIKFSRTLFTIDKAYAQTLIRKREIFREQTKTKKSIFITFITPYGVANNSYYQELVHSQLTLDDLF